MINIDDLLDMVYTEALGEGLPREHHFDETLNETPVALELDNRRKTNDLPSIIYTTELIQNPDGSYEWVD